MAYKRRATLHGPALYNEVHQSITIFPYNLNARSERVLKWLSDKEVFVTAVIIEKGETS